MFGDLHISELLEEVTLMRRALEGIRDELAQANELFRDGAGDG